MWLCVWVPVYWHAWGAANFLHLCDIAAVLTCVGLWTNSALLISSQAITSLVIDFVWTVDAGSRFFLGRHFIGGTEYLFNVQFPLWVRLLSLFHVVLPFLLLWSLARLGYDRRGWRLQSAIALAAMIASRFADPAKNINFAFTDVFFHRALGSAPVHIAISYLILIFVVYFPTHVALMRFFSAPQENVR